MQVCTTGLAHIFKFIAVVSLAFQSPATKWPACHVDCFGLVLAANTKTDHCHGSIEASVGGRDVRDIESSVRCRFIDKISASVGRRFPHCRSTSIKKLTQLCSG
ncbi:hypothetical protein B0T09DRAFT_27019 [Sordaria sp. MPI-SDFR-AT-0083]|nr:hypothetical protein B0T09DRAFT_27019 [Sordaria sp. MPI-SDFR-AT-0083]